MAASTPDLQPCKVSPVLTPREAGPSPTCVDSQVCFVVDRLQGQLSSAPQQHPACSACPLPPNIPHSPAALRSHGGPRKWVCWEIGPAAIRRAGILLFRQGEGNVPQRVLPCTFNFNSEKSLAQVSLSKHCPSWCPLKEDRLV